MNKEALIESIKEFLRVVVLSIVPILIISLESGKVDFKVIAVAAGIAGLRFIDKILHESDKALPAKERSDTLLNGRGIVGF